MKSKSKKGKNTSAKRTGSKGLTAKIAALKFNEASQPVQRGEAERLI